MDKEVDVQVTRTNDRYNVAIRVQKMHALFTQLTPKELTDIEHLLISQMNRIRNETA